MQRTFLRLAGVLFISLFLNALTFQAGFAKELIPLITPGMGGTAYVLGAAIGKITQKSIPDIEMVVQGESGSTTMLRLMHDFYLKGRNAFTVCDSNGVWAGYNAVGLFQGREKLTELRAITFLYGAEIFLVANKSSGIKTYQDIKGKRIGLGPPGSSVAATGVLLFEENGLVPNKDFKGFYLSYKEVADGIRDNSIDAGILAGTAPVAAYNELSLTHDVTIIPVKQEILEKISKERRYCYQSSIKKGSYKGIDQDIPVIAFGVQLTTHSKTDPELVYQVVKSMYEKRSDLVGICKAAEQMTPESALKSLGVPLHEGAEKYFKEIGVVK